MSKQGDNPLFGKFEEVISAMVRPKETSNKKIRQTPAKVKKPNKRRDGSTTNARSMTNSDADDQQKSPESSSTR